MSRAAGVKRHRIVAVGAAVLLASACARSSSAGSPPASTTSSPPTTAGTSPPSTTAVPAPATTSTTTAAPAPVSSTAAAHPVVGPPLEQVNHVVALGDSVPYGSACDCRPYPLLTAEDIQTVGGHLVDAHNDAVPGYQSGDVLAQLQGDSSTIVNVQQADVVEVEVGANDIAYSATCGTNVTCYEQELPQVSKNLNAIVSRVRSLTSGRPVAIVLLDYWSVWLGGQYAAAQGQAYVDAAATLTKQLNDDIASIAASTASAYVPLRVAFKGPNGSHDETALLAADGDHPNAAGHQRIADATAHTLTSVMSP